MAYILSAVVLCVSLALWFYKLQTSGFDGDAAAMRNKVEEVFLESWRDYSQYGWGYDVYSPTSHHRHNMLGEERPMGWIIVDSLDTLMVMYNSSANYKDEFREHINAATEWIDRELNFDYDNSVSLFETTIRLLGGLLSAYHLSTELDLPQRYSNIYLDKAQDLGRRLAVALEVNKDGVPFQTVNLKHGITAMDGGGYTTTPTAEFTTLQMEFKYLAYLTDNSTLWQLSEKLYAPLYLNNNLMNQFNGLVPILTNSQNGRFSTATIRLGSMGDSFYEYLLKQYQLTGEEIYRQLYLVSLDGIAKHLLGRTTPSNLLFIGEREQGLNGPFSTKMDHLVCFIGGVLGMGATNGLHLEQARKASFWNSERESEWLLAKELTKTCYEMYHQVPTGLAPEIVVFNDGKARPGHDWWKSKKGDFWIKPNDAHNRQRPEAVESIMFLYQLSGNEMYREWGYEIFQNFIQNTCVDCDDPKSRKYVNLGDVTKPGSLGDNMETFWLSETLKYMYYLFNDNVDLTSMVFTTEAHIFPRLSHATLLKKGFETNWHKSKK